MNKAANKPGQKLLATFMIFLLCLLAAVSAIAAPPRPTLLDDVASGAKTLPYYSKHLDDLRTEGVNTGANVFEKLYAEAKGVAAKSSAITGEFNVLAVLVAVF